jgi:anaphase-promoting complex subunit 4
MAVNPTTETRPIPEYDMLEVNHYLMSGLVVSSIDKWFMGQIPQFSPEDLGVPGDKQDLQSVLKRAQIVTSDSSQMAWQAVS